MIALPALIVFAVGGAVGWFSCRSWMRNEAHQ